MHNSACVGTHLYSIGTHQGYLLKSLLSMSRMTCFIPGDLFDIPGSGQSMRGYILACSRHQRENICQRMGYEQRDFYYCASSTVPHHGYILWVDVRVFQSRDSIGCDLFLLLTCCFTSTETVGLLGTGAQDGHLDFHTSPELWDLFFRSNHFLFLIEQKKANSLERRGRGYRGVLRIKLMVCPDDMTEKECWLTQCSRIYSPSPPQPPPPFSGRVGMSE